MTNLIIYEIDENGLVSGVQISSGNFDERMDNNHIKTTTFDYNDIGLRIDKDTGDLYDGDTYVKTIGIL